jgi:hypothetical protein
VLRISHADCSHIIECMVPTRFNLPQGLEPAARRGMIGVRVSSNARQCAAASFSKGEFEGALRSLLPASRSAVEHSTTK